VKKLKVVVKVPAKINLALKVGALAEDGFHPLETVFQAIDIYDEIIATSAQGLSLSIEGEGAEELGTGSDNLAYKAAALLAQHAGIEPNVHLHITKKIPIAGGLAGGSANAAGTLVACDSLWRLDTDKDELLALASQLGADVSFALLGGTALGRGRGEKLTTMLNRGEFHWVLAVSSTGLSTPEVYRVFDMLNPDPIPPAIDTRLAGALATGDVTLASECFSNDLQAAAIKMRPQIKRILASGLDAGAIGALVSGSGPTCAFLARNPNHALHIAGELQASGVVERTMIASGPAKGAHIVSREQYFD
jgi:4-diphosphocytidyl-2-C-methyl-D-erythritol kinase